VLRVGGTVAVISAVSPTFLIAFTPISYLYWYAQQYYSKTSRELKRVESITKSPLYSHFGETIAGSACIRAVNAGPRFCAENCQKMDKVNNLFCLMNDCNRWLAVRLELCGNGIVTGAALTGVISRRMGWLTKETATLVGLSLTLALQMTNSLGWMVRMSTETEAQMNSVERVMEYAELQGEDKWLVSALHQDEQDDVKEMPAIEDKAPVGWPPEGAIRFEDYSFTYRPELPEVLRNVSIEVKSGEKVGVCGRTGAGKSSMIMALYRMGLVSSGKIVIDGKDIATVPLDTLRAGLSIVPQEPTLFQGTIAYNLDPFGEFNTSQAWAALERVRLGAYVRGLPDGLESQVGEGGSSLSVGQRQLLCMARALLKGTKILVLDEATAAVDEETDKMIQAAVREACKGCTVVTIAHRLNTIMDYDKILVLGQGKVLEYDSPSALMSKPSEFSRMVASGRVKRVNSRGKLVLSESS